jgi:hypothetical protein
MLTKLANHYTEWGIAHWDFNRLRWDKQYMEGCKKSAYRHFVQWFSWETDEEHDMACVRNIFSYEMLKVKLEWWKMSKYMKDVLLNTMEEPYFKELSKGISCEDFKKNIL